VLLSLAGLASVATQARYFGVGNFGSAAVNCVAWIGTLVLVFYRVGDVGGRTAAAFEYLGEISFPLYILHYPVLFAVAGSLFRVYPNLNYGVTQVAISMAAAMLAYHFFDKPLRVTPAASLTRIKRALVSLLGRRRAALATGAARHDLMTPDAAEPQQATG